jgi:hypothetical protein
MKKFKSQVVRGPQKTLPLPKKRRTSWTDGDPPPDAAVVQTTHIEGVTYQRKFISCGKERCKKGCASGRPSHGPYWYATTWNAKTGKTKTVYVGKHEPKITEIAEQLTGGKQ